MPKPYNLIVEEAESAVAKIKDPSLKQIAFTKLLEHLLEVECGVVDVIGRKENGKADTKKNKQANPRVTRGPQAYILELKDDNFFNKPKSISEIKLELGNVGHHIPLTSLSGPLQELCKKKVLRRQQSSASSGKKKIFVYSIY